MNTGEVINYLLEELKNNGEASDKVFIGEIDGDRYGLYMDDYSEEFFIDKLSENKWLYKTEFTNLELNKIFKIDNWQ